MKVACTMNVAALLRQRAAAGRGERTVAALTLAASYGRIDVGAPLREDIFHDVAGDVGQAEVAPLVAVRQPFVIDPQ